MYDHDEVMRSILTAAREWLAGTGDPGVLDKHARLAEFVRPSSKTLHFLRLAAISSACNGARPDRLIHCIHKAEASLGMPFAPVQVSNPKPWRAIQPTSAGISGDAQLDVKWTSTISLPLKGWVKK